MTNPYCALCAELVDAVEQARQALEGWANYGQWVWPEIALEQAKRNTTEALALLNRARALLDQPVEEEPTDEELLRVAATAIDPYESSGIALGEYEPETECAVEVYGSELIAYARAVLAKWGAPMTSNARAQRLIDEFEQGRDFAGGYSVRHGIAAVLRHLVDTEAEEDVSWGVVSARTLQYLADALEVPTLMERAMAGDAAAARQFLHKAGFTDKQGQWLPQYQPIPETTND